MMFAFKEILYLISILIFIKWQSYLHWQINLMNIVQGFQESFLLIFVFEWSRFEVSRVFAIDFNFTAQKLSFQESYGQMLSFKNSPVHPPDCPSVDPPNPIVVTPQRSPTYDWLRLPRKAAACPACKRAAANFYFLNHCT